MQRNYSQQLRPQSKVQAASWLMLFFSLAAFVFVANTLYELGDAYLTNQRLIEEKTRLETEIERLEELYTNEQGDTLFSLFIVNSDSADVVINLPLE